ncbi:MAG: hypothetical protein COZ37_01710 [bacterium (Candidatus Ratteibacteria) CG_4_10_14_3_um_filter_41_18]|uniref:Cell division protein FtsL n=3 Tax=Candidatus Ratteibacteria TaxID=2979319 RepID=A0A2M7E932_9BACT|nr:MAG: hypothetical protein AUJ76_03875 [Candidatus Omnitrophica bacterium CG1_02_41_171]PIV64205.1 MAG: hypothetical protein COS11_03415 [bacterium (Candidatus Ratteibacteria) CG01_land_8_20_14_3_00_40_19]PIW33654.1 MAG: hypothetical protein COW28_03415 [bacterium (Candidatus Ratteibacteria) CG15_BIG_FIL_POST_REV_8_21_14_020_41_12]PIW74288.1 MAG: hypothetical protein CO004_01485 [bacterium (Candidatus Ratteibacteria) CG_4_8_14_3_um_filter_41_36]PIX77629.1 MAG: hypothetical protein COZ37_01710
MKKKRRNNPYSVLGILVIFILLLGYVWQHNTIARLGYSVGDEEEKKKNLLTTYRELNLKVITLKSPYRIKQALLRQHLPLEVPGERDVVIIKEAR